MDVNTLSALPLPPLRASLPHSTPVNLSQFVNPENNQIKFIFPVAAVFFPQIQDKFIQLIPMQFIPTNPQPN
jgi:hypothetical protein